MEKGLGELAKAMTSMHWFPVFLSFFLATARSGSCPSQDAVLEAESVWERAISAKGGRGRVLRMENILISSSFTFGPLWTRNHRARFETLLALPDRAWFYSDERPYRFGPELRVVDLRNNYALDSEDYSNSRLTPTDDDRFELFKPVLWLLLETRWQKPRLSSISMRGGLDRTSLRVFGDLNGRHLEYWFDCRTYLAERLFIRRSTAHGVHVDEFRLGEYSDADGLRLPTIVTQRRSGLPTVRYSVSYQIDVDYDPAIFSGGASLRRGPAGWKRPR